MNYRYIITTTDRKGTKQPTCYESIAFGEKRNTSHPPQARIYAVGTHGYFSKDYVGHVLESIPLTRCHYIHALLTHNDFKTCDV